jgi:hypothetical protein
LQPIPNNPNNPGVNAGVRVQTPGTSVIQTNPVPLGGTAGTNQGQGTNVVNVTNQVFNTNQVNITNQTFSTNFVSVTNRVGLGSNDMAATEFDRALVVQVRQRLYLKDPGTSASWSTVNLAARDGTMLVSGQVLDLAAKDSLIVVVRNTPGVVRVVDQVAVNPNAAAAGTVSRFLSPASDPSLGDAGRFSTATNRFGQRVFIPPARGTIIATNPSPTGPTNPGSTNIIVEGVVGTNVIVVPVDNP